MFDFTNIQSLINCKNWLKEALYATTSNSNPFLFLVGSKSDLIVAFYSSINFL